jgi:phage tail protein X
MAIALGTLSVPGEDAQAQTGPSGPTQTYVVQKGDTINSIARRFYGKSSLGPKLWNANKALVANPRRLTPGDTIYIFPESTLALNKPVEVPPKPESPLPGTYRPLQEDLYHKERLLNTSFPEYFSFVADPRGQGGTGITRIHVKRLETYKDVDPSSGEILETESTRLIDRLYEVHEVGEIIASSERGFPIDNDTYNRTKMGRLLLSTGDQVVVRFTQDLASILDSETYEDFDPYFNVFPIYGMEDFVQGPNINRPDYSATIGQVFKYRGKLNIVSRVEGLAPTSGLTSSRAKRSTADKHGQDIGRVSYVGKITYSEDAIQISDRIFAFVPTDPGPERRLDSPYTEPPDTYVSPGK